MGQTFTEEEKVCHFVENKAQPHRPLSLLGENASDLRGKHQEFEQTFVKTFWLVCQDVTESLQGRKPCDAFFMKPLQVWGAQITIDSEPQT